MQRREVSLVDGFEGEPSGAAAAVNSIHQWHLGHDVIQAPDEVLAAFDIVARADDQGTERPIRFASIEVTSIFHYPHKPDMKRVVLDIGEAEMPLELECPRPAFWARRQPTNRTDLGETDVHECNSVSARYSVSAR